MYKFFFTTLILMMISLQGFSQVPGSFGYQAVIRDSGGEIWANSPTMVRTTLFQQSVGGPIVYQGIHNTSTNEYGLINLKVGSPDTWISGSLYYAQWSTYPYFLRIEVDLGNGYVDMGSQQLLSVPSAMTAQHAVSATQLVGFEIEGAQDGQVIMWDGNNEIWEPSLCKVIGARMARMHGVSTEILDSVQIRQLRVCTCTIKMALGYPKRLPVVPY
jgi:hypothetical protein